MTSKTSVTTKKNAKPKKTTTKNVTIKKTIVEKTTTGKTKTRKASSATKTTRKSATKTNFQPLSLRTWRLLHAKAVDCMVEGGLPNVDNMVTACIKQRVFGFLGPIPTGVQVAITCEIDIGNGTKKSNVMRVVNPESGVVEADCSCAFGSSAWRAWSPSGTKIATVEESGPGIASREVRIRSEVNNFE